MRTHDSAMMWDSTSFLDISSQTRSNGAKATASKTHAVFFYANLNRSLLYSIMAAIVQGRIQ